MAVISANISNELTEKLNTIARNKKITRQCLVEEVLKSYIETNYNESILDEDIFTNGSFLFRKINNLKPNSTFSLREIMGNDWNFLVNPRDIGKKFKNLVLKSEVGGVSLGNKRANNEQEYIFMKNSDPDNYKFIDLFAGIGGFHIGMERAGGNCVFASEIDKHARETYKENFYLSSPKLFDEGYFNDDITKIEDFSVIPDFDILCGGFPCQPFSQAGFKKGFDDTKEGRGNMFNIMSNIIDERKPKAFFLENVRHILKHDDGRTFSIIKKRLEEELGYSFFYKIVKASEYGLPQHRARIFMVGFRKEGKDLPDFEFPKPTKLNMTMSDIFKGECEKKVGFTLRVGGRRSGVHDRRNWDGYIVDGVERFLTSVEGKKMQGFPEDFKFPVSETQAMKQLGNSVAINAVEAVALSIVDYLNTNKNLL